jgi:two-component system response regulator YesN
MNYRINESKKLLKTTNLPVYQIAERVGFNSSSHFIKIFKKNEEVTPLQFRNYRRQ